jgi:hypothetical protein
MTVDRADRVIPADPAVFAQISGPSRMVWLA